MWWLHRLHKATTLKLPRNASRVSSTERALTKQAKTTTRNNKKLANTQPDPPWHCTPLRMVCVCVQTETGGHMITPLPGSWSEKPGSASLPFFGVVPVLLDPESGKELEGETEGVLCIKQVCDLLYTS